MPERAHVTAVVVTHNSGRHLAGLGRAFSDCTVTPARLLAVDNASVDDSVEQARRAGFEVNATGYNRGFGAGCNVGLRSASTEFVLFCNPDVRPTPAALERLLDVLIDTPDAAIVGPAFDEPARALRFSRIVTGVAGFAPRRLKARFRHWPRQYSLVDRDEPPVVVDYAMGAFLLCRVAALESVGGFDESFFLYCEEEDLSRRLTGSSWKTLLVPSALVAHEHSSSSAGVDEAVMAPIRIHSLYWYYRKHRSRAYAECARAAIAACMVFHRAYRALTRQAQVYGPKTASAPFRSPDSMRRQYGASR